MQNLPSFSNTHITVVGDLMLDQYWHGTSSRISPEAPIPIVNVNSLDERPGGAANVALNIRALGGKVDLFGLTGQDSAADTLKQILTNADINCHFQSTDKLETIKKLRVIAHNQQLIRLDFEKTFYKIDQQPLLKDYAENLSGVDLVIISDYAKGIVSQIKNFIDLARTNGIPVLVDPKNKDFGIYRGATLITPNLAEFEAVAGYCPNQEILTEKAYNILATFGFDAILITRGAQGMSIVQKDQPPYHIPANAREVYDVTGAGDTVIATLGLMLASGANLLTATKTANVAASLTVKKMGAATVSQAELRRAIQRHENSWLGIISPDRLKQEVADSKAHGETIVMTNGCFDILHAGHVFYLEQAKSLGDRLIIAINDDASVRRLKGEKRPINTLMHRMTVLSALRTVDWVVPFSDDTPAALIESLNPDILVKGGDYQINEIAGAKHVLAHGGKVEIIPLVEGCSSTNIINKTKNGDRK